MNTERRPEETVGAYVRRIKQTLEAECNKRAAQHTQEQQSKFEVIVWRG
jgi:hypothetical protein